MTLQVTRSTDHPETRNALNTSVTITADISTCTSAFCKGQHQIECMLNRPARHTLSFRRPQVTLTWRGLSGLLALVLLSVSRCFLGMPNAPKFGGSYCVRHKADGFSLVPGRAGCHPAGSSNVCVFTVFLLLGNLAGVGRESGMLGIHHRSAIPTISPLGIESTHFTSALPSVCFSSLNTNGGLDRDYRISSYWPKP